MTVRGSHYGALRSGASHPCSWRTLSARLRVQWIAHRWALPFLLRLSVLGILYIITVHPHLHVGIVGTYTGHRSLCLGTCVQLGLLGLAWGLVYPAQENNPEFSL